MRRPVPFARWLRAYLLTLLFEIPIYVGLARGPVSAARAAFAGWLGSTITHPMLTYLWPRILADRTDALIAGEIGAAVIESAVLFALAPKLGARRSIGVAFLANGVSFGASVVVRLIRRAYF
ncbi:MAG: hypothetical protein H6684_04295 [Deltaproteobacteria bacterium]|nr:hypothetical protein [Deltaproteobacteria bacterium]